MSADTQLLQETLEKFGYVVLNRHEPLDVPSIVEVQLEGSEEWIKVKITERATIKDWAEQCHEDHVTLTDLGPYFYKTVVE